MLQLSDGRPCQRRRGRNARTIDHPLGRRLLARTATGRPRRGRRRSPRQLAVGGWRRGGSSASASGSTLTIADVAPFTGPDAALGPTYLVSCDAATNAINNAGGVLGHELAARASTRAAIRPTRCPPCARCTRRPRTSSLVIGCTSDEAASVVPIFGAEKTVSFCMTGQSEFDHVKFPYFYRLVPPDLSESYAMIAIAHAMSYKRVALAFGNDIGSQTFVQPAIGRSRRRADAGRERDARPQRDHVPHRGSGGRQRAPRRDPDRGARPDRRDVPVSRSSS